MDTKQNHPEKLDTEALRALSLDGVAITAALSQDGTLKPVDGLLEKLERARRRKIHTVIVADEQLHHDDWLAEYDDIQVIRATSLSDAILKLRKEQWAGTVAKISKQYLLRTFFGTLAIMLIIRPLLASHNWSHLDENVWIALFMHGPVGSVVWGLLIPYAVLWSHPLDSFRQKTKWSGSRSVLGGAVGGALGGLICAVLSVAATKRETLINLGWITRSSDHPLDRLPDSFDTGLFWAFPATGFLTGIGLGIFLYLKLQSLLDRNREGKFFVPLTLETRGYSHYWSSLITSCKFVCLYPPICGILFLLIPALAGFLLPQYVFHASDATYHDFQARSFGEGIIHAFGSFGLCVGFFFGIDEKA